MVGKLRASIYVALSKTNGNVPLYKVLITGNFAIRSIQKQQKFVNETEPFFTHSFQGVYSEIHSF